MSNYISILTAFTGMGTLAGPIMGSYLYILGGFKCPFFVVGIMLIFLMIIFYFTIDHHVIVIDKEHANKLEEDASK